MIPDSYTISNLKRALGEPSLFVDELCKPLYAARSAAYRVGAGEPTAVMDEDWDNLVVLDACRYDYFRDENWLNGELERHLSPGIDSLDWIEHNFVGREYHDTVYVTGNGFSAEVNEGVFHAIRPVSVRSISKATTLPTSGEEVAKRGAAVLPEDVVAEAIEAYAEFPDKRLIVHFMQPHLPLIGEQGLACYEAVLNSDVSDEYRQQNVSTRFEEFGIDIFAAARSGRFEFGVPEFREAYRENLRIGLKHVETLVAEISGRTVVTADHGELLGERLVPLGRRKFGHNVAVSTPQLREVPWLWLEGERRETVANPPVESERLTDDEVKEQLRVLGYR